MRGEYCRLSTVTYRRKAFVLRRDIQRDHDGRQGDGDADDGGDRAEAEARLFLKFLADEKRNHRGDQHEERATEDEKDHDRALRVGRPGR